MPAGAGEFFHMKSVKSASRDHLGTIFGAFLEHFGGSLPGTLREHFWTIFGGSPFPYSLASLRHYHFKKVPLDTMKIFLVSVGLTECTPRPSFPVEICLSSTLS